MASVFDGFVLRAPRTAPANAASTGDASNGVLRDARILPASYDLRGTGSNQGLVESAANQYRAAVLQNPNGSTTQEFLVFAANSSSLTLLEDPAFTVTAENPDDAVSIITGTLSVDNDVLPAPGLYSDGSDRLIVRDPGGSQLSSVQYIKIVRGDTGAEIEVGPTTALPFASQDADAGIVNLSAAILTALSGGVSRSRGDIISQVDYIFAAARFWWTRNDADTTRFGWNGRTQRWEPFKGGTPLNVGVLTEDTTYTLSPRPDRFAVGDLLPGDTGDTNVFSLIRVGTRPDNTATTPEVLVVSDDNVGTHAFGGTEDAVVGVTNGILRFSPAFTTTNAGRPIWYSFEDFQSSSRGIVGPLVSAEDDPLFIAPVPEITDRPFIRLGFRRYLTPLPVEDDDELALLSVAEGEVGWSRSSGRLKLAPEDIAKADPDDPGFDLQYLGESVYYDGVSLTQVSLRTRDPIQLVDDSGVPDTVGAGNQLFIPDAAPMPTPGVSGVLHVPDKTGTLPNTGKTPTFRPNGCGLIRDIEGVGDTIFFTPSGAIEEIEVVDTEADLPDFPFAIRKGKAWVAREEGSGGSRVSLGLKDRARFGGEAMYFLQAEVQPSVYTDKARFISREKESFTLVGDERLIFAVDGSVYLWEASTLGAGTYTAAAIATSIDAVITGTGGARASNGRIFIEAGDVDSGSVEIGWGWDDTGGVPSTALDLLDFTGAAVLGFVPGWRADGGSDNYLPDHGAGLGVFRSPLNKDRSNDTPDLQARARFDNTLFAESVGAGQQFSLDFPPLQDVAGYDENVFFTLVDGLNVRLLNNLEDVLYDFVEDRFLWLEQGSVSSRVEQPTSALPLGNTGIVADTLHPAVGNGFGLFVASDGGAFVQLNLDEDFLVPNEGALGVAQLVNLVGQRTETGGAGTIASAGSTTFTDTTATFITSGVVAGYQLKILSGDNEGNYVIDSVTSETSLEIVGDVPFAAADSFISWEIYEGFDDSVYDPAVVADVQYVDFNHLPEEPFKVRLLHSVGTVGGSLNAVVTDALTFGRRTGLRFGLENGSPTADLSTLETFTIGTMSNGSLTVPDVADPHFTNDSFSILVGSKRYTLVPGPGEGLLEEVALVGSSVAGDKVQYDSTGALLFGDTTLSDMEGAIVHFQQNFLPGAALATGEAEVDPATGDLNISSADAAANPGATVYFVEQMITEQQLDVFISPLNGTVYFKRPLREFQIVEVRYFQADISGDKALDDDGNPIEITEFLPLFVRQEEATTVDTTTYAFNPTGRTIAEDIEPTTWVGPNRQNFGIDRTATFDLTNSLILLSNPNDAGDIVRINYAVFEAFGGEESYSTSVTPVWRPAFRLDKETADFTMDTDRSAEMEPGKLLRIGASPVYIKASSYNAAADTTTVTVFPTPTQELGSRAPGNDLLSLLSSIPVTDDVDGVSTAAPAGFMLPLVAAYEPVDAGMLSIRFRGNVTQFAIPGHILELGGMPFIIVESELAADGLTTRIDVSTPFPQGFTYPIDAVKISARPIYQPNPTTFLGPGAFVETEGHELVLFGETDDLGNPLPGRSLVRDVHYTIDSDTGSITFVDPTQGPLQPGQKLYMRFTQLMTLGPFVESGVVNYPRYKAAYSYITTPNEDNQILGSVLLAQYTYRNPDSFYYRAVPLVNYLGEVAKLASTRVAAQSPSAGPPTSFGGAGENYDQGRLGTLAQLRDLQDQDRAARVYISLYNGFILAFEQISETTNGGVIGDRDGKFRFFIGRDRPYPPPGYEDQITGLINPRNVWSDVFFSASQSIRPSEDDIIVDPETATQDPTTLEVDGDFLNPFTFRFYLDEQNALIRNDMDDVILVRRRRPRLRLTFPLPSITVIGEYRRMAEPSRLSRLFPESALAFSTTFPGLEATPADPGFYTFRRMLEPPKLFKGEGAVFGSTFRQPIASLSNPAIGVIENVTDAEVRDRLPRARVWAYSSTGFPEIDDAFGTSTDGKPTVIATPLQLKDFPVNPNNGLPDFSRLASNAILIDPITGGPALADLPDLGTGDQELSTPGWKAVDRGEGILPQVAMGRITGETVGIGYTGGDTLGKGLFGSIDLAQETYPGVFVGDIQLGCIITFAEEDGTEIEDAGELVLLGDGELEGLPFSIEQGDTIFVIPPGQADTSGLSDPPTIEELEEFAKNLPVYRRGFDVGVQKQGGSFVDLTLPSFKDPSPFGLKELLNQRPPDPLSTIEADVEFVNTDRYPTQFPALLGEPTNDDGDYAIPYLGTRNTELDRLGAVASSLTSLEQSDSPTPQAVSPDEILGNDGEVVGSGGPTYPPATLLSAVDFTPVTTAGSYTPNSGIGDVQSFDLLFIETEQASLVDGAEGILQIGAVDTNEVEPARFVTPTDAGDRMGYILNNAMSREGDGATTGMIVEEVGGLTTEFDITTLGTPVFNDGASAATTGGLNNIVSNGLFPFPNDNIITLDIIAPGGAIVETITIEGATATGGLGPAVLATAPTFTDDKIIVPAVGFVDFTALGAVAPGPSAVQDFTISINTYNSGAASAGSDTAYIDQDRLTFHESIDLSTAKPRGYTSTGGVSLECSLNAGATTCDGAYTTVNEAAEVNGGDPFTFLLRDSLATTVGVFTPATLSGAGDEDGTVKVMGFEGHNNTPITGTPFTFSAIPSSDEDTFGTILEGTGTCEDGLDAVTSLSISGGSVAQVEDGDILVIRGGVTGGAIKAGTYLVRHGISEDAPVTATAGVHEVQATAIAGSSGWCAVSFPRVVSVTTGPFELVMDRITEVPSSPSGYNFASAGTLYVLKSSSDLSTALKVDYSAFVVNGDGSVTFTLTGGSAEDASGAGITNATFRDTVNTGDTVSGMLYLPIGQFKSTFPTNNVVGDDAGLSAIAGFADVKIRNGIISGGGEVTWSTNAGPPDIVSGGPASSELGIGVPGAAANNAFVTPINTPVYDDVAAYIDISGINSTQWDTIHNSSGDAPAIECIVPGDAMVTEDSAGSNPGFFAKAGIFLEPSWPTPVQDLSNGEPKVVDAFPHTMTTGTVGMRDSATYDLAASTSENVTFQVRRIRRFHKGLDAIGDNLQPLRFSYEIRTGTVASYTVVSLLGLELITLTTTAGGTQLGPLNDPDVNINAGDILRLVDADGNVLDEATIAAVNGETGLLLSPPGFTQVVPTGGETFQVFSTRAPVPHEQTNQQLFELITESVVLDVTGDPSVVGGAGGRVPSGAPNTMTDTSVPDWEAAGVQVGDILVVDPAGELAGLTGAASPVEYGTRPIGDQSVVGRGAYLPFGPSALDDNRGWYRVTGFSGGGATLEVNGETEFTGADGSDVIFGSTGQEYAVYPTISASALTGGTEGQMDLRPTAPADGSNSYAGTSESIEPFSYKIIRPTTLLSDAAIDLVLMNRERIKSWLELISSSLEGKKQGNYFVFQRDFHITDLGTGGDPTSGLGVTSNLLITDLSGLTGEAPYANVTDCLSVLGRRYWLLDTRLDREVPPNSGGTTPYSSFESNELDPSLTTGSGRPVLPDRIDDVLDRDDRLRNLRFAWIRFRTDRVNGSLFAADRFAEELPRLVQEQEDLLRLQEGLDDV